jgi:hypothetical protein
VVIIVRDKDPSRRTLVDRSMVVVTLFGDAAAATADGGGAGISSSVVMVGLVVDGGGGTGIATAMGKSSSSALYSIGGAVGDDDRVVCGSVGLVVLGLKWKLFIFSIFLPL